MAIKAVGVGDTPNSGRIKWNEADAELDGRTKFLENAANLLALLKTVDGAGSGLDADLLDGRTSTSFILKAGDTAVTPFTLTGDPTSGDHVVRRTWVENFFAAKDQKDNVRAATNAPLPAHTAASGNTQLTASANGALPLATFDNVSLAVGNRVLVKNDATGNRNLIYTISSLGSSTTPWVLNRAADSDPGELTTGAFVYVSEPLSGGQGGTSWWVTTPDPITVGTTAITWSQFGGPGAIQAGSGLSRTGNQIAVALEGITAAMIKNGEITADEMAAAHKDGLPGVLSLRTLGTGANQALPGDHASVTNARTPTAHAASHMTNGSDVITPVSIGALPNNDSRIHARGHSFGSADDHIDIKNAKVTGYALIYRAAEDAAAVSGEGYYYENPAAASSPPRIFPMGSHGFRGALEARTGAGRVIVMVTGTLTVIRIQVNTAPPSDLTLRINHNGTEIALPVIAAGTNGVVLNPARAVVAGDYFTMDITTLTAVGGADLSAFYLMQAA